MSRGGSVAIGRLARWLRRWGFVLGLSPLALGCAWLRANEAEMLDAAALAADVAPLACAELPRAADRVVCERVAAAVRAAAERLAEGQACPVQGAAGAATE